MEFIIKAKKELLPNVYFVVISGRVVKPFQSGQFFSFEVSAKTFRAYSVAYFSSQPPAIVQNLNLPSLTGNDKYVGFIVSCKPGGAGSHFFNEVQPETKVKLVGPAGKFNLKQSSSKDKLFISTGTGLAPFLSMFQSLETENFTGQIKLFQGAWKPEDDFSDNFLEEYKAKANYQIYKVYDEVAAETESIFKGRVTEVVPKLISNLSDYDFYLCGHPAMVEAMEQVLVENSVPAENIVKEKFG